MTAGVFIGAITVGVVSTWLRLLPPGDVPRPRAVPQVAPAAAKDEADRQPIPSAALSVAEPLEEWPRPESDEVSSPPASVSLALEASATAEAAFERARVAESKGQWQQAEHYYRQALTLNPSLVEARNNLGNLYVRQQQLSAAIGEFRAALAINPNYAMARNNLGSAYFLSGNETLAIQEFLSALSLDGVYVSPYYNLASLYARRGDAGQAIAFLTKALAIAPAVLSWLHGDPDFDGIRAFPEFQHLRTQGFPRR
jgi:tetratricopeptide (TPR) repeat protein